MWPLYSHCHVLIVVWARVDRVGELRKVFRAFDIDGSGTIGFDELFALGPAHSCDPALINPPYKNTYVYT